MFVLYSHTPQTEYHWAAGKLFYTVHTEVYCPIIAKREIEFTVLSTGIISLLSYTYKGKYNALMWHFISFFTYGA